MTPHPGGGMKSSLGCVHKFCSVFFYNRIVLRGSNSLILKFDVDLSSFQGFFKISEQACSYRVHNQIDVDF